MLPVGGATVVCPPVFAVEQLYQTFGKGFLQVPQQDDVVLPMIVDPAPVAFLGMATLDFTGLP